MGSYQSTPQVMPSRQQTTRHWKEEKIVVPGSELEWQINQANSEDVWTGVGREEGMYIWRIVKFKVTPWPKEDYGKFHEADAYIVLNSHPIHDKTRSLTHDVHFWIGSSSTHDKFGTAAYKTIELYNHLHGIGKQHREVQGSESKLFKSYFDEINILEGGSESGFKEVQPEQYQHRLLHFKGSTPTKISVRSVNLLRSSLNSGDVFVLDLGLHIIQWNGNASNVNERYKAKSFITAVKSNRNGRPVVETVEEGSECGTFDKILPQKTGEIQPAEMGGDDRTVKVFLKRLYRIGNRSNGVTFKSIAQGAFSRDLLDDDNGYLVDTGFHVFFWVGRNASQQIKAAGFDRAKNYVKESEHPFLPLTRLDRINQSDYSEFNEAFTTANGTTGTSCTIL